MERQFTRQAENALKLAKTTARSCGYTGSGQYCGSRNKRSPVQPESKKDH